MHNYQEQANNFAKKHGITLKVLAHPEYKKYFSDDKEGRYVFKMNICRKQEGQPTKQYTFTFGQSINAGNEVPTMYDVLTCFTKYDPEDFDNFCSEYGYDNDSRKAEKIYKDVCEEWTAVERIFSDILDELREIE